VLDWEDDIEGGGLGHGTGETVEEEMLGFGGH